MNNDSQNQSNLMMRADDHNACQWLIQMRGDYLLTRGVWERSDHRGYTNNIHEAGRYPEGEAKEAERMMPNKCKAVRLPDTQPAAKVPEELAAHIRKMIELHERRSVVLSVHMQELEELLDATPQQSGEWVRCENRLPIYPPDKLMRNMRDAHDYALNCKDDGIEGPAAIWSVQVYSAVRQWLLAQPSKDKQEGDV